MRRLLLTLTIAVASVALAQPADAQLPLKYGVQGALMTGLGDLPTGVPSGVADLNGTFGLGARVALQPPILPIGVVGQGVYYFPEGDGSYMTYSLAAQLRLPLPVISPYAIGGWQFRRTSGGGSSNTESGPMVGVGVQLNLGLSLFLEGTFEFNDEITAAPDFDNNPIVIKGGVLLG
ncbi:MAG: porin family protein [Gemmatimonadota bacterium]|nr:porin family protein [Gemmatimonadota bacterium]MDH3422366.1 porin family protein [Gemmatimonadota bacterium]